MRPIALAALAALACACAGTQERVSSPKENRAISIATATVKDVGRYQMHTAEGLEYAVSAHPMKGATPGADLWQVDYALKEGPADQGIHIVVDLNKLLVLSVYLDGA